MSLNWIIRKGLQGRRHTTFSVSTPFGGKFMSRASPYVQPNHWNHKALSRDCSVQQRSHAYTVVWHVVSQWTLLNLHDRFPESCGRCFKRTWRITDAHAIYDDFMNYIFWERMSRTVMLDGSNMASSKRQCLGMSPEFCRTSCLTKWFPGM